MLRLFRRRQLPRRQARGAADARTPLLDAAREAMEGGAAGECAHWAATGHRPTGAPGHAEAAAALQISGAFGIANDNLAGELLTAALA